MAQSTVKSYQQPYVLKAHLQEAGLTVPKGQTVVAQVEVQGMFTNADGVPYFCNTTGVVVNNIESGDFVPGTDIPDEVTIEGWQHGANLRGINQKFRLTMNGSIKLEAINEKESEKLELVTA